MTWLTVALVIAVVALPILLALWVAGLAPGMRLLPSWMYRRRKDQK